MAILTSIADFLHRRRRALAYTAVGAGAVWALGKYAQYKVEELAEKAELQRLAREK